MPAREILLNLAVALAIGLLIGTERGWKSRDIEEGRRVAGIRTYGLIGLLGGVTALITAEFGAVLLALVFVALAAVLTTAYVMTSRDERDVGITSLIASLLTFVLGALAAGGQLAVAAAVAVVMTLLLSFKPTLHDWVERIEAEELRAGLKLLLISVVLLPILPNRGFGPGEILNPFEIWLLVVLIAAISFVGYLAIRLVGEQAGIGVTGLLAGLASSTGATLHFARIARRQQAMVGLFGAGILLASGTMLPRLLLIAGLLNARLVLPLLVPSLVMAGVIYVPAFLRLRRYNQPQEYDVSDIQNPLELKAAILFGALLTLVLLFTEVLKSLLGDPGIIAIGALSGLSGIDAIALAGARFAAGGLAVQLAAWAIIAAAAVNCLWKIVLAWIVGGRSLALRISLPLMAAAATGPLVLWLVGALAASPVT